MTNERRLLLLGLLLTAIFACSLFMISPLLELPFSGYLVLGLVALAAMAFVGVGLVLAYRPGGPQGNAAVVRWVGVIIFAMLALSGVWSYIREVGAVVGHASLSVDLILGLANGTVTTLLIVWLCLRAATLLALAGRASAPAVSKITTFLTGLALVVVAINHVLLMVRVGLDYQGLQFRVNTTGMSFVGFTGWPFWNGVLLLASVPLLIGYRALLRPAVVVLALLFGLACPLVLHRLLSSQFPSGLSMIVIATLLPLLASFLFWWMQREMVSKPEETEAPGSDSPT